MTRKGIPPLRAYACMHKPSCAGDESALLAAAGYITHLVASQGGEVYLPLLDRLEAELEHLRDTRERLARLRAGARSAATAGRSGAPLEAPIMAQARLQAS